MPHVRVLRPFANGHHDDIVHPGDIIIVSEDRRKDLGELVADLPPGVKIAPVPDNKMQPAPENKAATPVPEPVKRRPGRPPGSKSGAR
jgi:hypothetical protein